MSIEEIGLFQLENLAHTPTRFLFLDLRAQAIPVHPQIDALLKKAARVPADQAEKHVQAQVSDKNSPVLLVCEDGKVAAKVARRLESAGFDNVYVIAGGVAGLLSEV